MLRAERAGIPRTLRNPRDLCVKLLSAVGKAAGAIERKPEMLAQRLDGLALCRVGIGIRGPHDDDAEGVVVFSFRWQHAGRKRRALAVAQGEKQRMALVTCAFLPMSRSMNEVVA